MNRMKTALTMGMILAATGLARAGTVSATPAAVKAPANKAATASPSATGAAPAAKHDETSAQLIARLPGTASTETLDKLNAAIFVAGRELKLAQLKRDIAKAREAEKAAKDGKPAQFQPGGARPGFPFAAPGQFGRTEVKPATATPKTVQYPTVESIVGFNGNLEAMMIMPDGHIIRVRQGDTIQDGFKVVSISPAGVRVQHAKSIVMLTFGPPEPISEDENSSSTAPQASGFPSGTPTAGVTGPGAPPFPPRPGSTGGGSSD